MDDSLFRGDTAAIGGTTIQISPIVVNDNLVDVIVRPGNAVGEPAALEVLPRTRYVTVMNDVKTIDADAPSARPLAFVNDVTNPDGIRSVTLRGDVRLSVTNSLRVYPISEPSRFAAIAFAETLQERGVSVSTGLLAKPDFKLLAPQYTERNRLAEHVSPPLSTAVQVMTKVSSNIHTAIFPSLVGAIAGHDSENPRAAENVIRRKLRGRWRQS